MTDQLTRNLKVKYCKYELKDKTGRHRCLQIGKMLHRFRQILLLSITHRIQFFKHGTWFKIIFTVILFSIKIIIVSGYRYNNQ